MSSNIAVFLLWLFIFDKYRVGNNDSCALHIHAVVNLLAEFEIRIFEIDLQGKMPYSIAEGRAKID